MLVRHHWPVRDGLKLMHFGSKTCCRAVDGVIHQHNETVSEFPSLGDGVGGSSDIAQHLSRSRGAYKCYPVPSQPRNQLHPLNSDIKEAPREPVIFLGDKTSTR
jgi:hypothetical protein